MTNTNTKCNDFKTNFLDDLKRTKTTYKGMIDFCCESLVLNNYIIKELTAKDFYFDYYCGTDYDEETDTYEEIYQYYIIGWQDAERLAEYTNEIVLCNDDLDLYILCVTHWGTAWNGVPSNWKESFDR